MNIETFVICDAATDNNGKLNLLGAFDTIYAQKAPIVHRACSVVLRMRFTRIEEGTHKLRIGFIDVDGKNIIPAMDGAIEVNFDNEQNSRAINMILNMQGLKLPHFGEFRVDLSLDGRHETSLPLFLKQMGKTKS